MGTPPVAKSSVTPCYELSSWHTWHIVALFELSAVSLLATIQKKQLLLCISVFPDDQHEFSALSLPVKTLHIQSNGRTASVSCMLSMSLGPSNKVQCQASPILFLALFGNAQ